MSPKPSLELSSLITEQRNTNSIHIDELSTLEVLKIINQEDQKVAVAVEKVLPKIKEAVDFVYSSLLNGGRLFYVGAGSSGRLAILDASECPPTFMVPPQQVQAVMAGGIRAVTEALEGSEDSESCGASDLKERQLTKEDVVIGITASGRTPYPIGALKYAQQIGCKTISLTCNPNSAISEWADCKIEVIVGPEVLTGSTRMKSGTAHKMVLNMISTTVMVKLGKIYENLMVDVHASNFKLRERAKRIVMEITGVSIEQAGEVLEKTGHKVKPALVMIMASVSHEQAIAALHQHKGNVRLAINGT
ncbi:N-acetylmuramic acid 6-phosphate etherase [Pullulanibacillus pueri]|uniref:N-acetylmuramic acid 6-phosphate etherase n=1 Tax=Pullulanibacillus pueri TaxID=1437324 RepID=A0A8J2ZTK1_9BACL|nr:N-acetylmuramic acid 6-phosphate etherase [Pullulanibacillus pueri]MBM7681856.1 N-acetylmuramic acid 6-phosphate etherase [Pullulanibacillus pueri]GGH76364.1 N-acetylmuramic acid 6-phosphate etherase [Pullulanibacillus pueri]